MKTKILSYRAIIDKDGDSYHGYAPSLSGCHTQGDTINEARANLKEAINLWLESRAANNQTIPHPDVERVESIESINLTRLSKQYNIRYT